MKKAALILFILTCATALLFFSNSSKNEASLGTHFIIEKIKDSLQLSK